MLFTIKSGQCCKSKQKATERRAMKILSLTLFLTPLLFHFDQINADFGRIEHETRLGENRRVDKDRRLVLDNDRYTLLLKLVSILKII